MTDVLSEIVDAVRVRGSLYFTTHFVAPWGVLVPAFRRVARFHLVVGGHCWVRVEKQEPIDLAPGDLVVVPHGASHLLADQPDREPKTVDRVVEDAGFTGKGALMYSHAGQPTGTEAAANLICGHFEYDEAVLHPFLKQLPPYILVRAAESQSHAWLDAAVRFIAHEARANQPGSAAIANRLSEIIFIQVVRSFANFSADENRFLAALSDPRVGRALEAIHRDPAHSWTVSTLAAEAAMSRARFAERFNALVGVPPAEYVATWRIRKAIDLLRDPTKTIKSVGTAVGFNSDRSFSRVFRHVVGTPPGTYRRQRAL